MKLLGQPRQPIKTPDGASHDLIAGEFNVDDDNLVANTGYGVFILRREDVFAALVVADEVDFSTLEGAKVLN